MAANTVLLIRSNIRKSRRTSIAFFLFIMLTVLLYHTGSQLTQGFQRLYQEKVAETDSADFAATLPYDFCEKDRNEIIHFGQAHEEISETEKTKIETEETKIEEMKEIETEEIKTEEIRAEKIEITDAILLKNATIQDGDGDLINGAWTFRNADRAESMSRLKLAEKLEEVPENGIYVPYVCKTFFGFQLGDTLNILFENEQETFIIAGFTEDVLFGSRSYIAFDLPENQFYSFGEKAGAKARASIVLVSAEGKAGEISNQFSELIAEKGDELDFYSNSDLEYAENSRSNNIHIYVAVMNAASLIGILACFVVIGFHMKNTLDKDAKEIGALKAMGYTGFWLVRTYVIQFLLLGLLGSVTGIAVSGTVMPAVVGSIATDVGFVWDTAFLGQTAIRDILVILAMIGVITVFSSRGIIRLRPVEAFQERTVLSRCQKSRLTVEKMPFPADLAISFKMMDFERMKSIFISLTIAVIMCVAGFAVILYARLVRDEDGLLQIVGAEVYSVNVQAVLPEETGEIAGALEKPEVRKVMTAIEPGSSRLLCEGTVYASLGVYSDYAALENPSIYSGRYPKHENEAAISGNLAGALDKKIGDTIKISQIFQETTREEEFLIVGLTQGTYTGGMDLYLTMEGLRQIEPEAEWQSIHVYLNAGADTGKFCAELEAELAGRLSYVGSFDQIFYAQFSPIVSSVSAIVFFIIMILFCIIIIMGYFVTNSILLTRKGDFGIMKALGYSNGQIVVQTVMTFMLYIAAGSVIGSAFLYCCSNTLIAALFRGMGVHKIAFSFPVSWIVLLILCAELAGALTAVLSALKIRKIVPCNLIRAE